MLRRSVLHLLLLAALAAPFALAQSPVLLARLAWMGDDARIVTNEPCSLTETISMTRPLADGTNLSHQTIERKWRDASGRFRKEEAEADPGQSPVFHTAVIVDPVAGTLTVLHLDRKSAVVFHLPDHGPGSLKKYVDLPDQQPRAHPGVQVNVEQLPGKSIDGVYAIGRRVTRIRPPSSIGNDRPVISVSERWVSPDLKILLASSSNDPRETQTRTVSQLNRADPDPSLFTVPADFAVREVPAPSPQN